MLSAWHEHVGGIRDYGIVSNADDVLGVIVLCCVAMRGVGGVCEMLMCLARACVGGEGGEWMRGLGLGFINPVGARGVLDVCLCLGCCGVGRGIVQHSGRVGWCYVCVSCESRIFV